MRIAKDREATSLSSRLIFFEDFPTQFLSEQIFITLDLLTLVTPSLHILYFILFYDKPIGITY